MGVDIAMLGSVTKEIKMNPDRMKLYIAIMNEVPDFIVPTLVAHTMLSAHLYMSYMKDEGYRNWLMYSYAKCVIRVNQNEFERIAAIPGTYLGHESKTLEGRKSCAIPVPVRNEELPNVLKYARLWKPL